MAVTLSTGATQALDQGQTVNITATVSNDSAAKGVGWVLTSGPGALSNQTTTGATYSANGVSGAAVITAASVSDTTKTAILTVTVTAVPAITTTVLPGGTEGTAYSQAIAKTGGAGAVTFTVSAGALPAGLTLSASGTISGTPTGPAGTASFTVKVTDSSTATPQTATQALTIAIALPAPPSITTATLSAGVEGTAYNQTVAATGGLGAFAFTVSTGSLPPGLSMSTVGVITGTPSGPNGTTSFTVMVTDHSNPPQSGTQPLSILINLPPAPGINPVMLQGGNVGTPYNQSVSVTGGLGPYAWSISSGTRPAGVNFTPGTTSATLSGIPTTAATYNFTVTVMDSSNPPQSANMPYSVVIGAILPLSITTSSLPGGTFNTAYGPVTITATGGFAPYSFGATGLPAGLILSSAGSLSGTPTAAGSFSVTITVTDSNTPTAGTANVTLPLTITAAALVLTPGTGNLPNATQSAAYTTSLTPSGGVGPYSISLDSTSAALPSALTFNSTSATTTAATITGTPAATGTTSGIIVDVTDSESPAVTQMFTYSLAVVLPCGSGSESLLNGQYAFALQGFDVSGNVALIGGVLTADGSGNLTAGAVDMNLSAGVQTNLAITAGSKYKIGSDARGCMAITTTAGTQNYRFSLGASGNGHMIDFDTTGPFTTGVLRKQTPAAFSTAQVSGNYAFGAASPLDSAQGGGKFAAAGVINLSGGSITGGSVDYNLYNATANTITLDDVLNATAWPASPLSIGTGGSYTVSGTNGRGTLSFTPSGGAVVNEYIYVVSSTELLIMSADARTVNPLFAGSARQQSGGPFGNTSLNGKSVFYDSKGGGGGTPNSSIEIGIVTTTGATGTFSFAGYDNGGGNIGTPTNNNASGTFSVAANGRVTLTAAGGGGGGIPEFYLFSPNNAFVVDSGNGVHSGLLEGQTSTSVSGTYAFGSIAPQSPGERDSIGAPVFSSPNVTGTGDDNTQGTLSPNSDLSGTYSVDASGVVFMPASCTPGTNCEIIGTVISSSKFVIMNAKSSSTQGGTTSPSMSIVDK